MRLRAAYDRGRLELSYTEIRAPIDGWSLRATSSSAIRFSPNTAAFRVTDLDRSVVLRPHT